MRETSGRAGRTRSKCVMILSDKSSGSSILQAELARVQGVHLVAYTRHRRNETLFWNKAAAVLGLPQNEMYDSELPFEAGRARRELDAFLQNNLEGWSPERYDTQAIFQAWERLCERYGPVFLEKTPHYLHCWSALELILQFAGQSGVECLFLGLVRNPMDTLYSSWRRWGALPERSQYDWCRAYGNLLRFKELAGDRLKTIRYEDLVRDRQVMEEICRFLGLAPSASVGGALHPRSVQRWRRDRLFGFQLSDGVRDMAAKFGYVEESVSNARSVMWPLWRRVAGVVNGRVLQDWAGRAKRRAWE